MLIHGVSLKKTACFFSHLCHLSLPSPCAGPAIIIMSHPVFPILCHVFCQLVFFHVSLYVGPPPLLRPTSAPSPRNHFSLSFSRKFSIGFTWASFLVSSCLMWSNLVFLLAHLNILISAEFNLFSSFFFTAQHSEPYVIAGLIIVFQFHWHLPIAHHPGYFLPLHPSDSYPIVDINMWTSLTREQWPDACEGCRCRQFSINNHYCGVCIICGARQVFCLCSADLQPMPLKHQSPWSQVFIHFFASHSTQHQVVREHHRPGWIISMFSVRTSIIIIFLPVSSAQPFPSFFLRCWLLIFSCCSDTDVVFSITGMLPLSTLCHPLVCHGFW